MSNEHHGPVTTKNFIVWDVMDLKKKKKRLLLIRALSPPLKCRPMYECNLVVPAHNNAIDFAPGGSSRDP